MIFAIDPGNEQSAYVVYDPKDRIVIHKGKVDNMEMLGRVWGVYSQYEGPHLPSCAIEMVASYGMAVGKTVFDTCVWVGRFGQMWQQHTKAFPRLVYRREVKLHLCQNMRANDANIRQAIIDQFGGTRQKAIGVKKNPGPLYGVSKDIWAALGVALTVADGER